MSEVGLYLVNLEMSPEMPGAPVLHLNLVVNAVTGQVYGSGEITQAVAPPQPVNRIPQVTGQMVDTGFGANHRLLHVTGNDLYSQPPAMFILSQPFSAAMVLDADFSGTGSFSYGHHIIPHCKVKKA